jgi:hypothetical protein
MRENPKENPADIVSTWREGTSADSPAGPLFTGGKYAPSEIAMSSRVGTGRCGSDCSGSATAQCC